MTRRPSGRPRTPNRPGLFFDTDGSVVVIGPKLLRRWFDLEAGQPVRVRLAAGRPERAVPWLAGPVEGIVPAFGAFAETGASPLATRRAPGAPDAALNPGPDNPSGRADSSALRGAHGALSETIPPTNPRKGARP